MPREQSLKARTPKIYFGKFHIDYYYFSQKCKDYFIISCTTGINSTLFAASYLHGSLSLRWAQHKCHYKSTTLIIYSNFKAFLQKDLGNSQAFINNIWSKFKKDSQYQLEEVSEYTFYIQYL